MVQIDPATGTVTTFPLPADVGVVTGFGGIFTYPDGDLGLIQNDPGRIYRIAIEHSASATPTFTVTRPNQSAPDADAAALDAASCVASPVPLNCDTVPVADPNRYTIIRLTEGEDVFDGSTATGPLYIIGGGGHDRITGSQYNDVILAGADNDTLNGGGGHDVPWATPTTTSSTARPAATCSAAVRASITSPAATTATASSATPETTACWVRTATTSSSADPATTINGGAGFNYH